MFEFKSNFAPLIKKYAKYRDALKFSNTHEQFLSYFDDFCYRNYPDCKELSFSLVKEWFIFERDIRPGRLRDSYFAINGFSKYINRADCVLPETFLQRKKAPPIPYIMTQEELYVFFDALNSLRWADPLSSFTMGCMIRLMYSSGLRPNEARQLKQENIDLDTGLIQIEYTKRHGERNVVLSEDMTELLKNYNAIRNSFVPESEYFFVLSNGESITQAFLWRAVNRSWKIVTSKSKDYPLINPYTFRHQFASTVLMKWLDEGKDLYSMIPYLKTYMGHKHFSSTVYYIHILPQKLFDSPNIDWEKIDLIGKDENIWEN